MKDKKPWYEKISIWITIIAGISAILGVSVFGTIKDKGLNDTQLQPEERSADLEIEPNNNDDTDKDTTLMNEIEQYEKEISNLQNDNNKLREEKTLLETNNKQLEKENTDLRTQIEDLENQQNNIPTIEYKDLGLSIDGEDISINKSKSMIIVDGKEYVSKEIMDKLIPDNQNVTITDNIIFIGRVIAEAENLFDRPVRDKSPVYLKTHYSPDNEYPNSYELTHDTFVEYNLDNKFSYLDITCVLSKNAQRDKKGHVTVIADDKVVYTSPSLDKENVPCIETGIPINKCRLLKIKYEQDNLYDYTPCIISDAIVYN